MLRLAIQSSPEETVLEVQERLASCQPPNEACHGLPTGVFLETPVSGIS